MGEVDKFLDTRDEFCDLVSDCSKSFGSCSSSLFDCDSNCFEHKLWVNKPDSVRERRSRLLRWMGISSDHQSSEQIEHSIIPCDNFPLQSDIARITKESEAVLRTSSSSHEYICSQTNEEDQNIKGWDDNISSHNSLPERLYKANSDPVVGVRMFEETRGLSRLVHTHLWKDREDINFPVTKNKLKQKWLKRLGAVSCIASGDNESFKSSADLNHFRLIRARRIPVYFQKKKSKELPSLYEDQEFIAHEGSISTMKFSLDGQYLASGGEDAIVRVWKVIEEDRPKVFDITKMDPSSLYFSVNNLSELSPLRADKEKLGMAKSPRNLSNLTCVVFPPKVFRLMEKPLHEFCGHDEEILDISWSRRWYLLSASVDKTIRLWEIGCHQCLKIFSHSNYVTCVDFNPMDDNYFISGSIDGKIRIWGLLSYQVIDWTDIKEIITAICYRPDGKGGILGTLTGKYCFYDIKDNELQLDSRTCLQGKKKKLPSKRITGFQFSPIDPTKLVITSADSRARILSGLNVICKFKGVGNSGTQKSACFTSDGRHIVSTGEDSNVHIWNDPTQVKVKKFSKTFSSQTFYSPNASISLPWPPSQTLTRSRPPFKHPTKRIHKKPPVFASIPVYLSSSESSTSSPGSAACATWPEEALTSGKMVKTACDGISSLWGMVIVSAGWDGRIRTFHNYGLPLN